MNKFQELQEHLWRLKVHNLYKVDIEMTAERHNRVVHIEIKIAELERYRKVS